MCNDVVWIFDPLILFVKWQHKAEDHVYQKHLHLMFAVVHFAAQSSAQRAAKTPHHVY